MERVPALNINNLNKKLKTNYFYGYYRFPFKKKASHGQSFYDSSLNIYLTMSKTSL